MKMKTIVTALLVCALAATALTGCGEKEPNYNDFSRNFATTILNPASYGDNLDELYKTEALKNFFAETVHEESVTCLLYTSTPRFVTYLGKVRPYTMIGRLVVDCLKGVDVLRYPDGLAELIGVAAVAGLHLWKKNTFLSIGAGTVLYMLLVQLVF